MKIERQRVFIGALIIFLVVVAVCFVIAYNKNKGNGSATDNQMSGGSASSISAEYEGIDYGNSKNVSDDEVVEITDGGSYNLSGSYESVTINTDEDVELNLNGVEINCTSGPAINVIEADTVSIVLNGTNTISATTTEDLDGAIYSKADLVFSGSGTLNVESNYDGIVSKDTLVIKSGTYVIESDDDGIRGKDNVAIVDGNFTINAGGDGIKATNDTDDREGYIAIDGGKFNITSGTDGMDAVLDITINGGDFTLNCKDDAIHGDGKVEINDGNFKITAAEGIEATYVKINGGNITIDASDDGINAGAKSTAYAVTIEINGGELTINMGSGDTDGIDANGNIYINGGTINITANSPFDYDGNAEFNGGTLIVNGEETDTITNQMMGGGMNGNPMGRQMNMNGSSQEMNQENAGMNFGGQKGQGRR